MMAVEPRFIVDANAGRLAKWLRVMGYDTLYFRDIDDAELVGVGQQEGRIVLTRDTHLAHPKGATNGSLRVLVLESDRLESQLRQVVETLRLSPQQGQFSRCIRCNQRLEPTPKGQVEGLVPPYVFQTQQEFSRCPECQRVYWQGTHWHNMGAELKKYGSQH